MVTFSFVHYSLLGFGIVSADFESPDLRYSIRARNLSVFVKMGDHGKSSFIGVVIGIA